MDDTSESTTPGPSTVFTSSTPTSFPDLPSPQGLSDLLPEVSAILSQLGVPPLPDASVLLPELGHLLQPPVAAPVTVPARTTTTAVSALVSPTFSSESTVISDASLTTALTTLPSPSPSPTDLVSLQPSGSPTAPPATVAGAAAGGTVTVVAFGVVLFFSRKQMHRANLKKSDNASDGD